MSWVQTPMGWVIFGGFAFTTHALAVRYTETVAAAAAFELWPLRFVYEHAWPVSRERQYLASRGSPATSDAVLGRGRAASAVLVLASQSAAPRQRVGSLLSWESALGAGLGLLVGVQAAAAALGGSPLGCWPTTAAQMSACLRLSAAASPEGEDRPRISRCCCGRRCGVAGGPSCGSASRSRRGGRFGGSSGRHISAGDRWRGGAGGGGGG